MSRLPRFISSAAAITMVAALAAFSPPPSPSAPASSSTIGMIADQLGLKVLRSPDEQFIPGVQFTGTLQEPEKLAAIGIKGMHVGARVIVACYTPERVLVEADELDPVMHSAKVTLKLNDFGRLAKIPTP